MVAGRQRPRRQHGGGAHLQLQDAQLLNRLFSLVLRQRRERSRVHRDPIAELDLDKRLRSVPLHGCARCRRGANGRAVDGVGDFSKHRRPGRLHRRGGEPGRERGRRGEVRKLRHTGAGRCLDGRAERSRRARAQQRRSRRALRVERASAQAARQRVNSPGTAAGQRSSTAERGLYAPP